MTWGFAYAAAGMSKACVVAVCLCIAASATWGAVATSFSPPFESSRFPDSQDQIDRFVLLRLHRQGIQPAHLCSDSVFVRRVYLDVIGTLPTAGEVKDFLASSNPNKRRALIDLLLERDEFADYWAMKWSDVLRVKAEFPINLWPNAAQAYHRWIRTSIKQNKSYDRFARELLCGNGSNFRVPEVNFYRAVQSREPLSIAQMVALTFMGTRADKWPAEKLSDMAAFFSRIGYKSTAEWKEEIVFFDPAKRPATRPASQPSTAVFPDGTEAQLTSERDPREVFADWLVNPKNPFFARAVVNRIWYWLVGRGIIHEPDDICPDNPAVNPALLAYLERQLIANHYDLKQIYRLILNSQTYQLSAIPQSSDPAAEANFAFYPPRRLDAEVLIDALCQITESTERYSSAIPEPFTFVPEGQRSIALPDGSITSSFLEMFGRPARDTGLASERSNQTNANQHLYLLNSSHIQNKLQQSRQLQSLAQSGRGPRETVSELYLTILSRFPTEQELQNVNEYSRSSGLKGRDAFLDVAWALINSDEFLYRH